ncbi:16S rRNA (cytidine(1402)-2'-O)-methyltransferase [Mesohalobacter halotolerans]|uniref:Ribosomal RNA small subunit methyltransferase I n=1 Tax=Mesohalobacter halotolerans TaxID=1883405 RepID=A0A4U5TTB3_9FLAO|nr:16S rRNA (cytidine(1402)-2'-O)-methyltransferase [Mesohalobacter halotolerans]TKS57446.1 16S rRNA (cytidine(1402)-2'-O)-methyltransferase [Mesohalobacter halotolerans]
MIMLYFVPTPIGNLKDMTYRGVEVLKAVNLILAEDTRVSGKLLKNYGIQTPMIAYHQHNEHSLTDKIIERLNNSEDIALITDAGTPGISDPGFLLSRTCAEHGLKMTCLPGATAFVPALVTSGLPNDKFAFEGFLPPKKGRQKRLKLLKNEVRTMIFYESPYKVLKTLKDFKSTFGGERLISISREISKLYEETKHGSIDELLDLFTTQNPKGEFVIIVKGLG